MSTQPDKDPKMGVWTPAYARWSIQTKTDEEFENEFKCSKQKAAKHCCMKEDEVKLVLAPLKEVKLSNDAPENEIKALRSQIEELIGTIQDKQDLLDEVYKENHDLKEKLNLLKENPIEASTIEKSDDAPETEKPDAVEQPKPAAKKASKKAAKTKGKETK